MRRALLALLILGGAALPAWGVMQAEELGAHRLLGLGEFQQVIDTKCTVCHTRERVDVAIRERRNLEKIEQQMLERGAVLSERDRKVLGTFWGSPLKEPAAVPLEPAHAPAGAK
jgi:hypothetical protein